MAKVQGERVASDIITNVKILGPLLLGRSANLDGKDLRVELTPYEHDRLMTEAKGESVKYFILARLNEALVDEGKDCISGDDCAYINDNQLGYVFTTT